MSLFRFWRTSDPHGIIDVRLVLNSTGYLTGYTLHDAMAHVQDSCGIFIDSLKSSSAVCKQIA